MKNLYIVERVCDELGWCFWGAYETLERANSASEYLQSLGLIVRIREQNA